jgi:outer membrane biosynthesis protein TonB
VFFDRSPNKLIVTIAARIFTITSQEARYGAAHLPLIGAVNGFQAMGLLLIAGTKETSWIMIFLLAGFVAAKLLFSAFQVNGNAAAEAAPESSPQLQHKQRAQTQEQPQLQAQQKQPKPKDHINPQLQAQPPSRETEQQPSEQPLSNQAQSRQINNGQASNGQASNGQTNNGQENNGQGQDEKQNINDNRSEAGQNENDQDEISGQLENNLSQK